MSRHHEEQSDLERAVAKKDEKRVRETDKTFDVGPEPVPGKPDHPTDPAAVDRRKQVVDENDDRQVP